MKMKKTFFPVTSPCIFEITTGFRFHQTTAQIYASALYLLQKSKFNHNRLLFQAKEHSKWLQNDVYPCFTLPLHTSLTFAQLLNLNCILNAFVVQSTPQHFFFRLSFSFLTFSGLYV